MSALPLQESKIQPAASSPSRSLCLNIAIKHDASSDLDEQKQRSSSGTYAKKSDDGGTFVPLTELSSARKRRRVWSNEEDALLVKLLEKHRNDQPPNWPQLAQELNEQLDASRTGKQCRERWRNQLRPNIKKGAWTVEEEALIRNMYHTFGPKWSCMAKLLTNRTDNDIKNKWYSMYRSGKVKMEKPIASSTSTRLMALEQEITSSQNVNQTSSNSSLQNMQREERLEFPPSFGLDPIVVPPCLNGCYSPIRIGNAPSASEPENIPVESGVDERIIGYSCSWGDLTF